MFGVSFASHSWLLCWSQWASTIVHCFGDTGTFRVLMMLEIGHSLTISLLVFVELALADRVWSFARLSPMAPWVRRSGLARLCTVAEIQVLFVF